LLSVKIDALCNRTFGPNDAILIIDVQNGFLPLRLPPEGYTAVQNIPLSELDSHGNLLAGTLAVNFADEIIPVINDWMAFFVNISEPRPRVMASLDWHPQDSCSFCSNDTICTGLGVDHCGLEGDENADCPLSLRTRCMDTVSVYDYMHNKYVQWPPHCIQTSWSAEFDPYLQIPRDAVVVKKGFLVQNDSYSAYGGRHSTAPFPFDDQPETADLLSDQPDLKTLIEGYNIQRLWITGIATDYCVMNSILDSLGANVAGIGTQPSSLAEPNSVILVMSATRGVDPVTTAAAIRQVEQAGAVVIPSVITQPMVALNWYCDYVDGLNPTAASSSSVNPGTVTGGNQNSQGQSSSANNGLAIGLGIGLTVLGLAIVAVLCVFYNRRRIRSHSINFQDEESYKPLHDDL